MGLACVLAAVTAAADAEDARAGSSSGASSGGSSPASFEAVAERLKLMRYAATVDHAAVKALVRQTLRDIEARTSDLDDLVRSGETEDERRGLRAQQGRLLFIEGELHRRAAMLLPEDDAARQGHIESAIGTFQDLRVSHRDVAVGELGYIGEARVHRVVGDQERALAVLNPLLQESRGGDAAGQSAAGPAELERLEIMLLSDPARVVRDAQQVRRQAAFRQSPALAGHARWLEARALAETGGDVEAIAALVRHETTALATHRYECLRLLDACEQTVGRPLMTAAERLAWADVSAAFGHLERAEATFEQVREGEPAAFSAADWRTFGRVLWQREAFAGAAEAFGEALDSGDLQGEERGRLLQWRANALRRAVALPDHADLMPDLHDALLAVVTGEADAAIRADALHAWVQLQREGRSATDLLDAVEPHTGLVDTSPALAYAVQALRWRAWHEQQSVHEAADVDLAPLRAIVDGLDRARALAADVGDDATAARAAILQAIVYLESPLNDAAAAEAALAASWPALQDDEPMASAAAHWRAVALLRLGRIDAAAELIETLTFDGPPTAAIPAEALLTLADALAERYAGAAVDQRAILQGRLRRLVGRALDDADGRDDVVEHAARLLLAVESYAEARRLLRHHMDAAAREPAVDAGRVTRTILLAEAKRGAGRLDEAVSLLREAIADHPESSALHMEIARAWRAVGNEAEAITAWRTARRYLTTASERWWEATLGLVEALADAGEMQQGRDILRAATTLYPVIGRPTLQQRVRDAQQDMRSSLSD